LIVSFGFFLIAVNRLLKLADAPDSLAKFVIACRKASSRVMGKNGN